MLDTPYCCIVLISASQSHNDVRISYVCSGIAFVLLQAVVSGQRNSVLALKVTVRGQGRIQKGACAPFKAMAGSKRSDRVGFVSLAC